ncbi:MAG: nitroreductase [Ilumatobacter sp.]|jgi:nitroreductase|uniref:nitroreductase family protein n=1 Tax=Ilumatobacter sp. TaxID=1967498 RepID=UPI00391AB2E5
MTDAFGAMEDGDARYEWFAHLVRRRRTSMFVDPDREVDAATVQELCGLATWAPNHKRTWPWAFAYFTGPGRARLGETMAADMVDADFGDDTKREKTRRKYLRTPGILVVGCEPHDNPMLHQENRDAVAAGIQNLLLGATALGLASFWSTPALTSPPRVLDLCGFARHDRIVGIIYLGWEDRLCEAPERPPLPITLVTG